MRDYTGVDYTAVEEPVTRDSLGLIDYFLRDLSAAMRRISDGQTPDSSGDLIIDQAISDNYLYKPGLPDNQLAYGGTSPSGTLTLSSTANSTKGDIFIGDAKDSVFDEYDFRLGINTASPNASLHVVTKAGNSATTQNLLPIATGTAGWGIVGDSSHEATDDAVGANDGDSTYVTSSNQTSVVVECQVTAPTDTGDYSGWTLHILAKKGGPGTPQNATVKIYTSAYTTNEVVSLADYFTTGGSGGPLTESYQDISYNLSALEAQTVAQAANNFVSIWVQATAAQTDEIRITQMYISGPGQGVVAANTILERLSGQTNDMIKVIPEDGMGDTSDRLMTLGSTGTLGLGNTTDSDTAVLLDLRGDVSSRAGGNNFMQLVSNSLTFFSIGGKGAFTIGQAGGATGDVNKLIVNIASDQSAQDPITVRDSGDAFNPWAINPSGQMVFRESGGAGTTIARAAGGSSHTLTWPNAVAASANSVLADVPGDGTLSWATLVSLGGAPKDAQYVVVANNSDLTAERRLQATSGELTLTDGGADGDITVSIANPITNVITFQSDIIGGTYTPLFKDEIVGGSGTMRFDTTGIADAATLTLTIPATTINTSAGLVTTSHTQTLTNKTLTSGSITGTVDISGNLLTASFHDLRLKIVNADATKTLQFQVDTITGGATRTYTAQDQNGTIALLEAGQTFTVGQTIDGTADETQLIVQGHSTQTSDLVVFEQSDGTDVFNLDNSGNLTIAGGLTTGTGTIITIQDTDLTIVDDGDNTAGFKFQCSEISTGETHEIMVADIKEGRAAIVGNSAETIGTGEVAVVNRTNVATDIGVTENLTNVAPAGFYLITAYLAVTATGPSADVDLRLVYNDGSGADTITLLTIDPVSSVNIATVSAVVYLSTGDIVWGTSGHPGSTARLTIRMRAIYLGE